jgi:hypothetical protein
MIGSCYLEPFLCVREFVWTLCVCNWSCVSPVIGCSVGFGPVRSADSPVKFCEWEVNRRIAGPGRGRCG